MRFRTWIEDRPQADPEERLVVLGDLDDGPGVDFFEENYLIHNVVSVVSGTPFDPRKVPSARLHRRALRDRNWRARFDEFVDGIDDRPLLA